MPRPERKDIWFNSHNGSHAIAAYFYQDPTQPVRAVVQLSHGMCEYIDRYADFAGYLAQHGIATAGNDHLGHGHSIKTPEDYGYFGDEGNQHVLQDLKTMNDLAHAEFPGVPVVLLGHSMGSFFARQYAAEWPASIDGLVISGTGGPNPLVGLGIGLAFLLGGIKGPRHRSALIHNMAFQAYLKRIESPNTNYDWISRDEGIVCAYAADEKCTFRFTVNGFHTLFSQLKAVSGQDWADSLPKELPTLLVAGEADPVGDYGKGVQTVYGWLHKAGVKNPQMKLYPGMRHEVLNELGREEVYADILHFIEQSIQEQKPE